MIIVAVGTIVAVGLLSLLMDSIFPSKPSIEYIKKTHPEKYDWVYGPDHGGVILDEEVR